MEVINNHLFWIWNIWIEIRSLNYNDNSLIKRMLVDKDHLAWFLIGWCLVARWSEAMPEQTID